MILQYEPVFEGNEGDRLKDYMSSGGWLTEFKETRKFENMIQEFLDVDHCSVVTSGTMAITIALLAGGIKPGDKVIVPALTMIATANAVKLIGAIPVFVDIESESLCLSLDGVETEFRWQMSSESEIKAVIYVSLNGRVHPDLMPLEYFCKEKEILLIEDACQAFGSSYADRYLGTIGDIGCFSFSSQKVITTGQGGALVSNSIELAKKIIELKDFGREKSGVDIHPHFGINAKFTDLQALVGQTQMAAIGERIFRKKKIYEQYYDRLHGVQGIEMFKRQEGEVPWFVDIYIDSRDDLQEYLQHCCGIMTRSVYPPIPIQLSYGESAEDIRIAAPVTTSYSQRGLWLPSSLNLSIDDIDRVCFEIKKYMGEL